METLKKMLRIGAIAFIIIVAAAGAGLLGALLPHTRERYMDKEIRIEQVDKKRDEEDDSQEEKS